MLTSFDIFCKLPGVWSFVRTINNVKEPLLSGLAKGKASFTQVIGENNLLYYKETGVFNTSDNKEYSFHKEYFFSFNKDTQNIEKYFSQNGTKAGLFYILGTEHTAEHLCIKDRYRATYSFDDATSEDNLLEFSLTYNVSGPAKNYISVTKYNIV